MDDFDISESMWRRGWQDAKRVVLGFWFWMFEALGGAILGAIVGWWAIAWLISGFFFVWIGCLQHYSSF